MKLRLEEDCLIVEHLLTYDGLDVFENEDDYYNHERKCLEKFGFENYKKKNESIFNGDLIDLARFVLERTFEKKYDNTFSKFTLDIWCKLRKFLIEKREDILNAPYSKRHGYFSFIDMRLNLIMLLLGYSESGLYQDYAQKERELREFEYAKLKEYRDRKYVEDLPIKKAEQLEKYIQSPCYENFCYTKDDSFCEKCFYFSRKPKTNLLNLRENKREKLRVK